MSGRWASSLNEAAAELNHTGGFFAVDLDYPSGHFRANDSGFNFTWSGNTYVGVGSFGGFEEIQESVEFIARGVKLVLTGIDSGLITAIKNDNCQNRDATIYVGLVDPVTLALVDTPEVVWAGKMDTQDIIVEGRASRIEVQCEHRLRNAPAYSRFSDADQKARSSGDRGFDMLHFVEGYQSTWGGKATTWNNKPGGAYRPQ